ncbi:hypothetical protein GCM10010376_76970 [Streptomyces violaceusniger]
MGVWPGWSDSRFGGCPAVDGDGQPEIAAQGVGRVLGVVQPTLLEDRDDPVGEEAVSAQRWGTRYTARGKIISTTALTDALLDQWEE